MSSQTPNIGLTLPIGSEKVSRQIINENNTKIDAAIAGKAGKELLGYKEDGDTASQAIADGSFVVWKGSLYKANGSISQGTAFSGSNLTAVTDGGFNDLQSSVDSLSDSIIGQSVVTLLNSSVAVGDGTWQSVSTTVDLSNAKYLIMQVGSHGSIYNEVVVPIGAVTNVAVEHYISSYWDSLNLGQMKVGRNGAVNVIAKAGTLAFDYKLYKVI